MFKKARILGIGRTPFFKESGRSVLSLALEATENACADAGIDPQALDAAATFEIDDSIPALTVLNALGCPKISWFSDLHGGANISLTTFMYAAMLVEHGLVDNVVLFRAINGRSVPAGWQGPHHHRVAGSSIFRPCRLDHLRPHRRDDGPAPHGDLRDHLRSARPGGHLGSFLGRREPLGGEAHPADPR